MNIVFKANYGFCIEVTDTNVKIEEDAEERIYKKDEKGKITGLLKRDVKSSAIDDIVRLLSDMIYYREADYDSSDLIEQLFEKLPSKIAENLSKELAKNYSEE